MGLFSQFISEMFVHGNPTTGKVLIAFRSDLWLFDRLNDDAQEVLDNVFATHPDGEILAQRMTHGTNADQVLSFLQDNVPDAVTGWWDGKTITLQGDTSPRSSPLLRKVVRQLGAKSVSYNGLTGYGGHDRDFEYPARKIRGQIPKILYHGTASKYLERILSIGLSPGESKSNYGSIVHPNLIFLTARFDDAAGHAFNTAGGGLNKMQRSYPVVVAVHLPDPNLLVPDFDVDSAADSKLYNRNGRTWRNQLLTDPVDDDEPIYSVPSERAGKHAGRFGYGGRVPASHIVAVLFWTSEDKWTKVKNLIELRKRLDHHGSDFTYRYGEFPPR